MYKFVRKCKQRNIAVINNVPQEFMLVDTFSQSGFELNEFGCIRSDFSQLVNSQSLLVMNQAANRLKELSAIEPDNTNKSFEEIVASVRPRWCQSPKQMMEFEKYLIDRRLIPLEKEVEELKAKKDAEEIALQAQADATIE